MESAVAQRVYEQIAKVVDAVDPDAAPGHPIPPILLDDKLGETPCREALARRMKPLQNTA